MQNGTFSGIPGPKNVTFRRDRLSTTEICHEKRRQF